MTEVKRSSLPHGAIPFQGIKDGVLRSVVMQLNENILSLKRQLSQAQAALVELQRGR